MWRALGLEGVPCGVPELARAAAAFIDVPQTRRCCSRSRSPRRALSAAPVPRLVVDLVSDEEGLEAEAAPSRSLASPGSLDDAARSPCLGIVLPALVFGLNSLYRREESRPLWMRSCTDDALRAAGAYDPERGLGVRLETDWGNNAGSMLVLLLIDGGLVCWTNVLDIETQGFATSGRGPDNRRTNFVESLLNELQHRPELARLRDVLIQAWRLCFVAAAASWSDSYSNCHQWRAGVRDCPGHLLPSGAFDNSEANAYAWLLGTPCGGLVRGYLVDRLGELPDVDSELAPGSWDGFPDRPTLSKLVGFSRNSSTVKQLISMLEVFWERRIRHEGCPLRFCFRCNREPLLVCRDL